jgi:hypothetical protein
MNPLLLHLSWADVVIGTLAGLALLRQLLVILTAEQGRKHDLVKKLYKNNQEFQLSILIPFLDPNEHPTLLALLHAIHEQDYPTNKVTIHLVTSEDTHRDLIPRSLRPNVKVWKHPDETPRYETAITWLIERCLAAGGNGMFVFLKPTDIIKPDFFQNIAARGIDSFALQGYVALKNPPETPLERVYALSTRLFNRIGNAGRYHLGLSCRLLDSGWAIKQEVLEMIPYRRGMDLDNLEYTIRLNLENFRVNWAPNVVVYSDSNVHFLNHFTQCIGTLFNRISLLFHYGPRLLTRLLMRFDLNYLEQCSAIVAPPFLITFMALVLITYLKASNTLDIPGTALTWGIVATLSMLLNIMSMVVARCKPDDYAAMLFYTPISYFFGVLTSPIALYSYIRQAITNRPQQGTTYRKTRKTRFNEDLDSPPDLFDETTGRQVIHSIVKKNAPTGAEQMRPARRPGRASKLVSTSQEPDAAATHPVSQHPVHPAARQPKEVVRPVPLSNGKKQVSCRLRMVTTFNEEGRENYRLILEYKAMSFSTESYRILDQAFYELHAKLFSRGLTIVTCGSCGNFYNPTVDVPDAIKSSGVCLFNKQGKEVNLNTDAVTVVSQACDYHCPLEQREQIVRQWKESLTLSRTT